MIAIDSLLTRAEGHRASAGSGGGGTPSSSTSTAAYRPAFQRGATTQFEASPMALSEVGDLVFRVRKLRRAGSYWLRGHLRNELLHDAQILLDSGTLSASQRSQVAQSLLRRLDNVNFVRDHW